MNAIEQVEREIARLTEKIEKYKPSPQVLEDAAVAGNNKPVVADFHGTVCGWADNLHEREWLRRLEYREAVKAAFAARAAQPLLHSPGPDCKCVECFEARG